MSEFEEKLKNTMNHLEIEDVCQKLNSRYEHIEKNTEVKEEEMALAAFKKQFESMGGTESKTGNSGESIIKHQDKLNFKKREFHGTFWYCDKRGHKAFRCEKKKEEDERKSRKGNSAINKIDEKYVSDDESVFDIGV